MTKDLKELEKQIGKVPKFFQDLTVNDPEMFEMVMKLEGHIWDDGALTRKTKKLIAIAIAASLRDQHATHAQPSRGIETRCHQERSRRGAPRSISPCGDACICIRENDSMK